MSTFATFIPLILIIVVFYFFVIRPQSKQQKEVQKMRDNIKVGDEVLTIGGFYGIVYAIDDKNVVLEMLPDFNKTMVIKTAISRVITEEESLLEDEADVDENSSDEQEVSQKEDTTELSEENKDKQEA